MKTTSRLKFKVIGKKQETPLITTLQLDTTDGKPLSYIPGQYITVYFPNSGTPEGKAYSLSSSPHEKHASITIKKIGEFSSRLSALEPGDTIEASLPYGFFYSESRESDMVLIAAGIGIAPFRSMILHNPHRKILLFYSVKKEADAIFKKEFDHIKNLNVTYYHTQEGSSRIDTRQLVDSLPSLASPEFFICGGIAFVRDIWTGLRDNGVPEEMMYTEAFF